jgi:hypothetical protein
VSTPCRIDPDIPLDAKGYPRRSRVVHGVRYEREHQAVLAEKLGRPIGEGLHAAHRCNVKACIEGDHLYEATPKQNEDDKRKAGRMAVGTRNGRAKVTEADIPVIRARYHAAQQRGGHTGATQIARDYKVSVYTIYEIGTGRRWAHVKE